MNHPAAHASTNDSVATGAVGLAPVFRRTNGVLPWATWRGVAICAAVAVIGPVVTSAAETTILSAENGAYRLSASIQDDRLFLKLFDKANDFNWAEGEYIYLIGQSGNNGSERGGRILTLERQPEGLAVTVGADGLVLTHRFVLPLGRPVMEEAMIVANDSPRRISLRDLETGFSRLVGDRAARPLEAFATDTLTAVPFRRRPDDDPSQLNELSMADVLTKSGYDPAIDSRWRYNRAPAMRHHSEGWAWKHGEHTLGIYSFNQDNMNFSTITRRQSPQGHLLRFGGYAMVMGEPGDLTRIDPGQKVNLGLVRYQTYRGDYTQAVYGFRDMLDEKGCRFPDNYNPPVHWNALYDNPEFGGVSTPGTPAMPRSAVRKYSYSKTLIENEAAKAREFGAEALYLDPGWDTQFGSFLWGEKWLGPPGPFIQEMQTRYGLKLSLHCPLATWMTRTASSAWPKESFRMDEAGTIVQRSVCQGSRQYLDSAAARLLALCADGVAFLMFDGNQWNDGCWNPGHGHPVPYLKEDHIRAQIDLTQRVKRQYPRVLVEMHDMIAAGTPHRMTPVYYKYSLPHSYDENWGFEFMWRPLDEVKSGAARSLYYYNLGCNIPMYLHIDLHNDDEKGLAFWWYASTCRHLGIGGTQSNPMVAEVQKQAMKRYRELERFYKQGEFYGISEEIHLHVLPRENAFVVNVFNLSDEKRVVAGTIPASRLGVDPDRWYIREGPTMRGGVRAAGFANGTLSIAWELPAWSTQLLLFRAVPKE